MTEEEEFEFRARLEAEQGSQSKQKAPSGFFNDHPNLKTALQIGVPLAAGVAAMPLTGGLSLIPAALAEGGIQGLVELGLQGAGVNEKDPKQAGVAAALPGAFRAGAGVLANIPKYLPGFGEAARAAITPEARQLPGQLFPGDAKAAYQALGKTTANQNPHIQAFPRLGAAVKELEKDVDNVPWDQLQQRLKLTGQEHLFEQISNTLRGSPAKMAQVSPTVGGKNLPTGLPKQTIQTAPARPPGLHFEEAKAASEGLNKIIMATTDPKERGVYQKLRGALLDDVEHAPMPTNASNDVMTLWKTARLAAKSENARAKLSEATERAIKTKDGVDIFDPNQVVKWLRTNNEIKSRVSPQEHRQILNEYRNMSSVVGHNLGKFWGMILGSATGAVAGGVMGGPIGSVAGLSAGTAGYAASEGLARAMMSDTGRKWVRAMMSNPTESNFRRGASLLGIGTGAALRSGGEGE